MYINILIYGYDALTSSILHNIHVSKFVYSSVTAVAAALVFLELDPAKLIQLKIVRAAAYISILDKCQ